MATSIWTVPKYDSLDVSQFSVVYQGTHIVVSFGYLLFSFPEPLYSIGHHTVLLSCCGPNTRITRHFTGTFEVPFSAIFAAV